MSDFAFVADVVEVAEVAAIVVVASVKVVDDTVIRFITPGKVCPFELNCQALIK